MTLIGDMKPMETGANTPQFSDQQLRFQDYNAVLGLTVVQTMS